MRVLYDDVWKNAAITDSTEVSGYPGTNTQHKHLSKYWKTSSPTAQWIMGEFAQYSLVASGTEGAWTFDEGAGPTAFDYSGNARDLTTLTNIAWNTGISGVGFYFADRAVIRAAYGAAIDFSAKTALSLSWWSSKGAAATSSEFVLSYGVSLASGVVIYCTTATDDMIVRFGRAGANESVTFSGAFDTTLRHYVLTFDLATRAWIVYRDGAVLGAGTLANVPVMPNTPFVVGNATAPAAANGWIGSIDEVRLYSRVLTAAEVYELYSNPGRVSYSADSIALVGHNLAIAATVTVQVNNLDTWAAPNHSKGGNPSDHIIMANFGASLKQRYYRVSITDPTNPDGFIRVGRIYLCNRWESTEEIDSGFSLDVDDTTLLNDSISGQTFADLGVRRRIYSFSMGTMKDATKVSLAAIADSCGPSDPVIVEPAVGIERIYALMTKQPVFTQAGGWSWKDDGLVFKEAL